jgi:hypothetical protein
MWAVLRRLLSLHAQSGNVAGGKVAETAELTAAETIAKVLDHELKREEQIGRSLDARAGTVITTSGSLVTLLFALVAIITRTPNFELHTIPRITLIGVLISFLLAAVFAILVNIPRKYLHIEVETLARWSASHTFNIPLSLAGPEISRAKVSEIDRARLRNKGKARLLFLAVLMEVLAVVLLGATVSIILIWD